MFVDLIVLCLLNLFFPEGKSTSGKNEDLTAFFFGASPWGRTDNSKPIDEDYDQGPDW